MVIRSLLGNGALYEVLTGVRAEISSSSFDSLTFWDPKKTLINLGC